MFNIKGTCRLLCNRCLNVMYLMYQLYQNQSWTHSHSSNRLELPAESFGVINDVKYKLAVREFICLVMNNRTRDICDIQMYLPPLFLCPDVLF